VTDIVNQINAAHRAIGNHPVATGEGRSVLLRRTYPATIDDVWDACTGPGRLARWLGQVDGDLRLGGRFQIKDNAGGEIVRCEEPRLLQVTWSFGGGVDTEVEVRLTPDGDGGTVLELEHSSPAGFIDEMVRTYGPGGTIGIGGGWDIALFGLDRHLHGADLDPVTWESLPEVREFAIGACHAWGAVIQAAWGTSDADIAAAIAMGVQQYAPPASP
jgi:uncharacterized protein YndB with AHSA1/START domain